MGDNKRINDASYENEMNKTSLSIFFFGRLFALLNFVLKQIEILSQFPPLLSNNFQHLHCRLRLLLLSHDAQVQPSNAKNHLPELSLPLSVLVQLAL